MSVLVTPVWTEGLVSISSTPTSVSALTAGPDQLVQTVSAVYPKIFKGNSPAYSRESKD